MLFPRFRTRILEFISHVSSIVSQKPAIIVIFFSPAGVTLSHRLLVWIAHVTSPDILSDARTYHVVSGAWLKGSVGVQHEALQLKVISPSASFWLLVERNAPVSSLHPETQPLPISVEVCTTSPRRWSHSHYNVVAILDMPSNTSNPLTVCDFAALLRVVAEGQPAYDADNANSYWFMPMIINAIEVEHGACVTPTNTRTSARHLGIIPVVNSMDIKRDMHEVKPAWAAQKDIYRAKKTTQEVSLGLFALS